MIQQPIPRRVKCSQCGAVHDTGGKPTVITCVCGREMHVTLEAVAARRHGLDGDRPRTVYLVATGDCTREVPREEFRRLLREQNDKILDIYRAGGRLDPESRPFGENAAGVWTLHAPDPAGGGGHADDD